MTAVNGAATKISTRDGSATWRRISPMRPSAASLAHRREQRDRDADADDPTGIWLELERVVVRGRLPAGEAEARSC